MCVIARRGDCFHARPEVTMRIVSTACVFALAAFMVSCNSPSGHSGGTGGNGNGNGNGGNGNGNGAGSNGGNGSGNGNGNGGNGNPDGGNGQTCGKQDFKLAKQIPDLLIIQDRSG